MLTEHVAPAAENVWNKRFANFGISTWKCNVNKRDDKMFDLTIIEKR